MRYGIVRHEQAVGIFILLCILLGGCHRRRELVGFYCSGISKGNIVQGAVRQAAVCRSGNIHRRKVKIISAAGGEGKLFLIPNGEIDVYKIACIASCAVIARNPACAELDALAGVRRKCRCGHKPQQHHAAEQKT